MILINAADSENMGERNCKIYSRQKFSAAVELLQFLALLIFLLSANTLLCGSLFSHNICVCIFASIPPVLETLHQKVRN